MADAPKYIPGVCNIDTEGRKKRAIFGGIVVAISFLIWLYLQSASIPMYWQLLLVIPLFMGFNGLWQAKLSFCVGNASRHQFEIGGKTVKITDSRQIAADKKKAMQVNLYSIACAALLTIILILISAIMK